MHNKKIVGAGVGLVLLSILSFIGGLVGMFAFFLPLPSGMGFWLMATSGTLILASAGIGLLGKLLCLGADDVQARAMIAVALLLEMGGAYMTRSEIPYGIYVTVFAFLVFVAFLSRVATIIERQDLARFSSLVIYGGFGIGILFPFVGPKLLFGPGGAVGAIALLLLPFVLYLALLLRISLALLRD